MSWCNYYYNPYTGEEITNVYKSQADLRGGIGCAVSQEDNKIVDYTIDKDSKLWRDYYFMTFNYATLIEKSKTKDEELLKIMEDNNIDKLIVEVN